MKRWIILLGRGGTTLIAVGCALLLVSLIPPAYMGGIEVYSPLPIAGKTWASYISRVLTPQEEMSITIRVNGTVRAYLLETSSQAITEWIKKRVSGENTAEPWKIRQEEYLLEYLEANPHLKVAEEVIVGEVTLEYAPTKITNVTLVLHNPNPNPVEFKVKVSIFRTMAPKVTRFISQIVILLGFALTIPQLMVALQGQRRRKGK